MVFARRSSSCKVHANIRQRRLVRGDMVLIHDIPSSNSMARPIHMLPITPAAAHDVLQLLSSCSVISFGGRPELSAHHALATLNEVISGGMIGWVLEADLKNFFGSLNHDWVLRFVEHRVGDPRLISLIRRWLKASVLEDGAVHLSQQGTPQGGSVSVLLSNVYLHVRSRPLVWTRGEGPVAGRSPTGALDR